MQTFSYHEKPSSKIPVWAKTVRKTLSLMKAGVRCNDPEKKERIKKRLISLRLNSNMKNYPEWFSNHPQSRLAVYTVLFGDYDTVKPVKYKSPKCDYYIITDQPVDDGLGWTKIEREIPVELRNASNAIKNRYFKMHPDVLFPDYEYSLYLDTTMIPCHDLFPLLGRMGDGFIGMYLHNSRDCIYDEAATVARIGKISDDEAKRLSDFYKREGFPEHFGLTCGGIILRRHHSEECRRLMQKWWEMYLNGPKRDQLSLMYCLWEMNYSLNDVACLGVDYEIEARFSSQSHKQS